MENVGGAIKWAILQRNAVVHVTTNAESVATWAILKCVVTPNRAKGEIQAAVQVVVEERVEEDPVVDEGKEIHRVNAMYAM